jgi:hypothetical protein
VPGHRRSPGPGALRNHEWVSPGGISEITHGDSLRRGYDKSRDAKERLVAMNRPVETVRKALKMEARCLRSGAGGRNSANNTYTYRQNSVTRRAKSALAKRE